MTQSVKLSKVLGGVAGNMSDANKVYLAIEHLKAAKVTYAQYERLLKAGSYRPKDGSTTEWGKALALLNQVGK